jgi:drug/metabolite transporter (DMT)-like permease
MLLYESLLNYTNVPLAILIVVLSSFLFAGGATIQHLAVGQGVDRTSDNSSMGLKQLWQLVTNRKWLLGLSLVGIGATAHIIGLMMAPVTVVQPVGILAVPWSVLLAARIFKHKVTRPMWIAVGMTVLGITIFTVFAAAHAAPDTHVPPVQVLIGCIIVYLIGGTFGFLGWKGPSGRTGNLRSLMWATGGSFFYGLSSALIKTVTVMMREPGFHNNGVFWIIVPFLIGSYLFGGIMIQQGYATGPAETVVASMTTTDPVVGVVFGLVILGEGALITAGAGVGMALAAALAIWGVVVLSKHHPDAVERRERAAAQRAGAVTQT